MRDSLRTSDSSYSLQSQPRRELPRNGLFQTVLIVLVIDATLTAIRGVDFVRYVFTESRFAVVAVVSWLGLSALSVFLFRRFRAWAGVGFPQQGRAVATVIYAYLLLALGFGLTLEYLAGLAGVDWLETGGDEPNYVFSAVGLSITSIALVMTVLTVRGIRKRRRVNRQHSVSSPVRDADSDSEGRWTSKQIPRIPGNRRLYQGVANSGSWVSVTVMLLTLVAIFIPGDVATAAP